MSKSQAAQGEPGKTSDGTKSSGEPAEKEAGGSTPETKIAEQDTPPAPASDRPLVEGTEGTLDGVAAHTPVLCGECCPFCCDPCTIL